MNSRQVTNSTTQEDRLFGRCTTYRRGSVVLWNSGRVKVHRLRYQPKPPYASSTCFELSRGATTRAVLYRCRSKWPCYATEVRDSSRRFQSELNEDGSVAYGRIQKCSETFSPCR